MITKCKVKVPDGDVERECQLPAGHETRSTAPHNPWVCADHLCGLITQLDADGRLSPNGGFCMVCRTNAAINDVRQQVKELRDNLTERIDYVSQETWSLKRMIAGSLLGGLRNWAASWARELAFRLDGQP